MSEGYLVVEVPPRRWWQRRSEWLVVHLAPTGRAVARARLRTEYDAATLAYRLNTMP